MDPDRREPEFLLRHFLAALAYRAQKALRGAPGDFGGFQAGNRVRTPRELLHHMTGVLIFARGRFRGQEARPEPLPTLDEEVRRFHAVLEDLSRHLAAGDRLLTGSAEQLLQGPLSDVMTHVGQLALLRRLCGSPVPPENFAEAAMETDNVSENQAPPRRPHLDWSEPEEAE